MYCRLDICFTEFQLSTSFLGVQLRWLMPNWTCHFLCQFSNISFWFLFRLSFIYSFWWKILRREFLGFGTSGKESNWICWQISPAASCIFETEGVTDSWVYFHSNISIEYYLIVGSPHWKSVNSGDSDCLQKEFFSNLINEESILEWWAIRMPLNPLATSLFSKDCFVNQWSRSVFGKLCSWGQE